MKVHDWNANFDKYIHDNHSELIGYYNKIVQFTPNGSGYDIGIYEYSDSFGTNEQYEVAKNIPSTGASVPVSNF